MITTFNHTRLIALGLTFAFLVTAAHIISEEAQAQDRVGQLTVNGMVKINGRGTLSPRAARLRGQRVQAPWSVSASSDASRLRQLQK